MFMRIEPYIAEHVPLVQALNERLRRRGVGHQLTTEPQGSRALTGIRNRVVHENYLVLEGNAARGGYTLIRQNAAILGQIRELAFLQLPLSEGIIEQKYASVGLLLLKDAMRRVPLLFGLGMGGLNQPLPKLFRILGAHIAEVSSFVRIRNARSFLLNLQELHRRPLPHIAANIVAFSGLGQLCVTVLHTAKSWNRSSARGYAVERETHFGEWIDEIWDNSASQYSMVAVRDRETLQYWYAHRGDWLHLLKVRRNGKAIGWAIVGDACLHGHKYFGDARLGSVVDSLALEGHEPEVIAAATSYLEERGVDLIISNQSHPRWCAALVRSGYLKTRSNYLFAAAPALRTVIAAGDPKLKLVHMTRGDGDSAYNLN